MQSFGLCATSSQYVYCNHECKLDAALHEMTSHTSERDGVASGLALVSLLERTETPPVTVSHLFVSELVFKDLEEVVIVPLSMFLYLF